jgi:hypothetical protein
MIPGSVVKIRLKGIEQMPGTDLWSLGYEHAIIVILTDPDLGEAFREGLDEVKRRCTRGGKIADIRIVRSLPEGDIIKELRDDPIKVHIALAVGMGGEVDGYAIDKTGEIRAMIQIEATQKILIGFPGATVLCHDHTRNDLQNFSWAQERTDFKLGLAHPTFGGRPGNPREIIGPTRYYYRLQGLGGASRRLSPSC